MIGLVVARADAMSLEEAAKELSKHYFITKEVKDQMKLYEKMYIPEDVRDRLYPASIFLRMVIERRVVARWSFP